MAYQQWDGRGGYGQQPWGGAGNGWPGNGQWPQEPPPQQQEEPLPPEPVGTEGFHRLSKRVFVVPEGTTAAAAIEELNEVHSQGLDAKNAIPLDPTSWEDEAEFASQINKTFRVKGGKAGPKFWKGVREAVMKLCGAQDVVCMITVSSLAAADNVQALLKNLFGAADTKAVADQLVGLKSGKVIAVLLGWDVDEVKAWPLVADDPIPPPPTREELARRYDPDDMSQYYAQYNRQAPPRQVPPRQRHPMGGPAGWGGGRGGGSPWQGQQQRWNSTDGGYGGGYPSDPNTGYPYDAGGGYGGSYGGGGGYQQEQYPGPYGGHGMPMPTGQPHGMSMQGGMGVHMQQQQQQQQPPHGLGGYGGGGMDGYHQQQQHAQQQQQQRMQQQQHMQQQHGYNGGYNGGGMGGGLRSRIGANTVVREGCLRRRRGAEEWSAERAAITTGFITAV